MRLAFGVGTGAYENANGFGEALFAPQLLFTDVNAARVTYLQVASRNTCFSTTYLSLANQVRKRGI